MAEKALDYFPNQAVVHYYSGIANAQLNQAQDAITAFKTGLNLTSKNTTLQGDLLKNLLPLYVKNQKLNDAKALLSKYLAKEAEYDFSVLEVFGDTFFTLGEVDNALLYWNKSLQKGNKSNLLLKKISDKKI
jgi:tetratricopeptide (TPR) repeat protein